MKNSGCCVFARPAHNPWTVTAAAELGDGIAKKEVARSEQYVKWLKEQVVFTRERMAFTEKNQ